MKREHTDREYEAELRRLREQILLMGARVEEMIAQSAKALVERNSDLAHRTIESDHQINRIEVDTDDLCLRILAKRQPVASDLRFITIALKVVTDIERIGDLGVNICERVAELNDEPPLPPIDGVNELSDEVVETLHEAVDVLVTRDAERAVSLLNRDATVDQRYAALFGELLELMANDPSTVYRATRIQSIAKYRERIADHAMNIAEDVVFLVRGKDIRHANKLRETDEPPAPPPIKEPTRRG